MSTFDSTLIFQDAARGIKTTEERPVLRFALYPGELLRIPRGTSHVHVLSGTAWISAKSADSVAGRGACIGLPKGRDAALISGLGGEPLLFEVWRAPRLQANEKS